MCHPVSGVSGQEASRLNDEYEHAGKAMYAWDVSKSSVLVLKEVPTTCYPRKLLLAVRWGKDAEGGEVEDGGARPA